MVKKRIRRSLISVVIEQIEIWEAGSEFFTLSDHGAHLINELKEYREYAGSKNYLSLSPKEDKVLQAAVNTHTYWDY